MLRYLSLMDRRRSIFIVPFSAKRYTYALVPKQTSELA